MKYFQWFLFLILFSGGMFFTLHAQTPIVAGRISEKIPVAPGDSLLPLGHRWILPSSFRAFWKNGKPLISSDFTLQAPQGLLRLKRDHPRDTLYVNYRFLPFSLPTVFYLYRPQRSKRRKAVSGREVPAKRPAKSASQFQQSLLRKSGSLTRSVTVGSNQGLRMDSGLHLQLSGQIAPGVQVVAALTDQNTPIQPEGNTQTLNELDRVFIQVKSARANATLGDFYLNYNGGRYENYRRKLQGVQVESIFGRYKMSVSGAVSRGKFTTNRFNGREGDQGPYQLRGDQGQTDIIVLAGTEKVWVDGQPMTRGDENDYVIEYGSGQITFTRHRLITADSRIEVDFEYSDLKFPRNLWSARSLWSSENGRLALSALFVREADDKNRPLDESYSASDLARLREIGDRRDSAYVSGAQFVGAGKGNFIQIDSAGTKIYRYLGPNLGDYRVRFSYVGQANGDYRYLGAGRYTFVGHGLGSYRPVRLLTLPQSQNFTAVGLALNPIPSLRFSGELALSQFDPNTFSRLNDASHFGKAYQTKLIWEPKAMKLGGIFLGKLHVQGNFREEDRRFHPVSRVEPVEYTRKWNLQGVHSAGERVGEFQIQLKRKTELEVALDGGQNRQGTDFMSERWAGNVKLAPQVGPQISFQREWIASRWASAGQKSGWLRQKGRVRLPLKWLAPEIRYEGERKAESLWGDSLRSGFRYDDWTTAVSLLSFRRLKASAGYNWRNEDRWNRSTLAPDSRARTRFLKSSLQNWHHLSVRMEWTARRRDYESNGGQNRSTLLSDLAVLYTPFRRGLVTDWRYQVSTTRLSKQEKIYLKVEPGRGTYRFDENLQEYVPDPFGDYVLRRFSTGDFIPITDVQANFKIRFHPKRFLGRKKRREKPWKVLLRNLAWESYLRLDKKSSSAGTELGPIFRKGEIFPPGTTVFGRYQIREDFFFLQSKNRHTLRFRWLETGETNNRYTEGGQSTFRQEQSLRWTGQVGRTLGVETSLLRKRIRKRYKFVGRQSRNIRSYSGRGKLSYYWHRKVEFQMSGELGRDTDFWQAPQTVAFYWVSGVGATLTLRGRGRIRTNFNWAEVRVTPKNRLLPYEMAGGRAPGRNLNWLLAADYRLSARLMLLLSYTGRKDRIYPRVVHIGRVEMKAYF